MGASVYCPGTGKRRISNFLGGHPLPPDPPFPVGLRPPRLSNLYTKSYIISIISEARGRPGMLYVCSWNPILSFRVYSNLTFTYFYVPWTTLLRTFTHFYVILCIFAYLYVLKKSGTSFLPEKKPLRECRKPQKTLVKIGNCKFSHHIHQFGQFSIPNSIKMWRAFNENGPGT